MLSEGDLHSLLLHASAPSLPGYPSFIWWLDLAVKEKSYTDILGLRFMALRHGDLLRGPLGSHHHCCSRAIFLIIDDYIGSLQYNLIFDLLIG